LGPHGGGRVAYLARVRYDRHCIINICERVAMQCDSSQPFKVFDTLSCSIPELILAESWAIAPMRW